MGTTSHEDEAEAEDQVVPEGAIDGIYDIIEGRLATKQDLAEVLEY
jgi:hypothetical protein